VPGASSQSPHNSLLYNEKSSVWKTLRPTGRPTAHLLLKTAPLVASSEIVFAAAAWTSDRDWPKAEWQLSATKLEKEPFAFFPPAWGKQITPARACQGRRWCRRRQTRYRPKRTKSGEGVDRRASPVSLTCSPRAPNGGHQNRAA
jgi:hypothetical protein